MSPNQRTPSSKKTALVTGGSRGIGKAIVSRFKEEGWNVATCATRASSLTESPADLTVECDVANQKQVRAMIDQTVAKFGKIDALVNNAGFSGSNPLSPDSSDEMWHRIVDINLHGTYYFCKYGAPHIPNGTGHIVNIASVLALKGVPDQTAYCAAKHAVLGFSRAFSHEMAPRKITVNTLCPGWVDTDMGIGRIQAIGMTVDQVDKTVPLGRLIRPEEIADFVYFLCTSKAASMITGHPLTIDGGSLV
ncbi:MAG: SDR family oxidoreductase [Bdellovibrio sp.]|nr:SDR family oxidoreductase [Bdellovibrio sp.]